MRKIGAVVVVVLGVSVAVAGPGSRPGGRTGDAFGSDYESRRSTDTAVAVQDAKPLEQLPPAGEDSTKAKPAPAPQAVGGCNGGCGCAAGCHGSCWQRAVDWLTYHPLEYGVHCETCGPCGVGACCGYHCNPSPYLYFLHPCVEGAVAPPACTTCAPTGGCGTGGCSHCFNGLFGRLFHHGACATCAP